MWLMKTICVSPSHKQCMEVCVVMKSPVCNSIGQNDPNVLDGHFNTTKQNYIMNPSAFDYFLVLVSARLQHVNASLGNSKQQTTAH